MTTAILEKSAGSDLGNVQDEKLIGRVGGQLCVERTDVQNCPLHICPHEGKTS
jgi:hypothetical protein